MNCELAVELYRQAAEAGNDEAQWRFGACLQNGNGVPSDQVEACFWYRKSAESGFPYGMFSLALQYREGKGCERNQEKAFELFESAMNLGLDEALMELAGMYYDGSPCRLPDRERARECLEKAAKLELPDAENALKYWMWTPQS